MEVVKIKVAELGEYKNNVKIHTDSQIKHVTKSIERLGFLDPILIDNNNVIIAGHGRLRSSIKAGLEEVPCIRLTHLSEDQAKQYRIVDNQCSISSPLDSIIVDAELMDLSHFSMEDFGLGFNFAEGEDLGDEPVSKETSRGSKSKKPKEPKEPEMLICPKCGNAFEETEG
jgi:ribosomal protein S16